MKKNRVKDDKRHFKTGEKQQQQQNRLTFQRVDNFNDLITFPHFYDKKISDEAIEITLHGISDNCQQKTHTIFMLTERQRPIDEWKWSNEPK